SRRFDLPRPGMERGALPPGAPEHWTPCAPSTRWGSWKLAPPPADCSADLGHSIQRGRVGGKVSGDLADASAIPDVADAIAAPGAGVEAQHVDAGAVRSRGRPMIEDRHGAVSIGQRLDEDIERVARDHRCRLSQLVLIDRDDL